MSNPGGASWYKNAPRGQLYWIIRGAQMSNAMINKSSAMRHPVALIIFQLIFINNASASRLGGVKQWLPDLEFSTKSNWINNKVPSRDSRLRFPLLMEHSVGLPLTDDLQFSGIELPYDGSLLLPANGKLRVSTGFTFIFKQVNG